MQIAVDGPAGAGKSTIAKEIAKAYKITYLDTGAMYRCIANEALVQNVDFKKIEEIIALAQKAEIDFKDDRVFCNNIEVTEAIRTPIVSMHTSKIAAIKEIRALLVKQQQEIAKKQSVIMDGRDIGSVVLPEAEYKFYLDADVSERAIRRLKELKSKGINKELEDLKKEIEERDHNDSSREVGPLKRVPEAIVIDTTGKKIHEVCALIKKHIDEKVTK